MRRKTTTGWTRWIVLLVVAVMFVFAMGFFRCDADSEAFSARGGFADGPWEGTPVCTGFDNTHAGA